MYMYVASLRCTAVYIHTIKTVYILFSHIVLNFFKCFSIVAWV